jgi:hypothetical protein
MYGKRAKELRRCEAITMNGWGEQCKQYARIGYNLCVAHLNSDERDRLGEGERAFRKLMGKRNKLKHKAKVLKCHCQAYNFPHHAGAGLCRWPYQPSQRLETESDKKAALFRAKLRRKGITPNAIKEKIESRASDTSKLIDLDFDPSDLSMEEEYLSNLQYETDVLSLPIEERRAIQKQRLIAEYMIKIGKADIDGEGLQSANSDDNDDYYIAVDDNGNLSAKAVGEDDGDLMEIEGEVYRIG